MMNAEEMYQQIKGKWCSIYPIYFDSTKTISEGRRISKEQGVPEPKLQEISRAVGMCKIKNFIEPHKAYSRNFLHRGRLKVEIFDDKHEPVHKTIPNRRAFYQQVGKNLRVLRNK